MYCHISVYKHCIDSQVDGNLVLILMFGKSHVSPVVPENKNMRVRLKKEMVRSMKLIGETFHKLGIVLRVLCLQSLKGVTDSEASDCSDGHQSLGLINY